VRCCTWDNGQRLACNAGMGNERGQWPEREEGESRSTERQRLTQEAQTYIRRIRNPAKAAYARAYLEWMKTGDQRDEGPEHPQLGYMGAQAVRMTLIDIMEHGGTT
jgi:hypothetical protein